MHNSAPAHSIISVGNDVIAQKLLDDWHAYQHIDGFRAVKKQFRYEKPALIVACITSENDEQISQQVTDYVRNGLANFDTRIILIRHPEFELDEINWLESLQVNSCLSAEEQKQSFNVSVLNRELATFSHIDNNRQQHDAETQMLMCITQFSRDNVPLNELLKDFSVSLSNLCRSACGFHLRIDNNQGTIEYCDRDNKEYSETLNKIMGLPTIPGYLTHVLNEKKPQIELIQERINLTPLEHQLDLTIGGHLTFPIVAYDKVLYLLFYLIPESLMGKVSMRQINVINKASEQLTILLERREAENSLKKQYERLKKTLVELNSAKQELQHKEKMASIGQMAAGIAHEINNPLSYVISNFSSMDHYLKSIMQLQDLQTDFLKAIETGQDQNLHDLKKNISDFEEEEDIPFILEDIRAVISDSHSGLQRVKNIITDLKSFTYSHSTELERCDLQQVIDETVKMLKHELGDTIAFEQQIAVLPEFMAHNGLMQQVFSNLIKNAIQALKIAQTPEPKVAVTAKAVDNTIDIRLRDNGPGIPEDLREKIFEPFFTTKTVGEGTGLGLSVTFNIIKKLGGEISVDSEADSFTEFTIQFPVKQ